MNKPQIRNPKTGRLLKPGTKTYNKALREMEVEAQQQALLAQAQANMAGDKVVPLEQSQDNVKKEPEETLKDTSDEDCDMTDVINPKQNKKKSQKNEKIETEKVSIPQLPGDFTSQELEEIDDYLKYLIKKQITADSTNVTS